LKRVIIVGGGVVGLHLARRLAALSIEVELHESKGSVSEGAERASGIVSIRGLSKIGLDYKGSEQNVLHGAYLKSGNGKLRVRSKEPMAYVLDRPKLAKACERAARAAGARIILGSRLSRDELVELADDNDNIIVGADGAVSTVARTFGFPSLDDYILTYKAEYTGVRIDETDMVGLYFSSEFAHGLFGWHVPYSEHTVEIGLGIDQRRKLTSKKAFDRFIGSGSIGIGLSGGRIAGEHASLIPISARKVTVKGNVALVGDAAGQVKATTGGGIIYGCLCAETLAKAAKECIDGGAGLDAYEKQWRKRYGRDLGLHRIAHSYYSKAGEKGLERTFRIMKALGMEGFLGKYGDMDSPSAILKRFLLGGSSA
jgi:flavin-dependent dehydrogenase